MIKKVIILFTIFLFFSCDDDKVVQNDYDNKLKTKYERTEWFRDAKLGAIIHFAPGIITGKEIGWSRAGERRDTKDSSWFGYGTVPVEIYDNLYKEFSAEKFNADEWIVTLKNAGLKYIVFTTKHWDGFCNFDTKHTDFKITNPECPYGKDIVKEIVDACRRNDFRIGLYYARPDWYHPDYYTENHSKYIEYFESQVLELINNYGKLDLLWFDGGQPPEMTNSYDVLEMIYSIQPDILVNDRLNVDADFISLEFEYQDYNNHYPWEGNFTLGEGWSWKPEEKTKSLKEIITFMAKTVGRNGNFSLGIGPKPDGSFTESDKVLLNELGQWLDKYGEAYYETKGGPFSPKDWGTFTFKDNYAYMHILNTPEDLEIKIPNTGNKILNILSLNDNKKIDFETDESNNNIINIEQNRFNSICTILKIKYENKLNRSVEYE